MKLQKNLVLECINLNFSKKKTHRKTKIQRMNELSNAVSSNVTVGGQLVKFEWAPICMKTKWILGLLCKYKYDMWVSGMCMCPDALLLSRTPAILRRYDTEMVTAIAVYTGSALCVRLFQCHNFYVCLKNIYPKYCFFRMLKAFNTKEFLILFVFMLNFIKVNRVTYVATNECLVTEDCLLFCVFCVFLLSAVSFSFCLSNIHISFCYCSTFFGWSQILHIILGKPNVYCRSMNHIYVYESHYCNSLTTNTVSLINNLLMNRLFIKTAKFHIQISHEQ